MSRTLDKVISYYKQYGAVELTKKVINTLEPGTSIYIKWCKENFPSQDRLYLQREKQRTWENRPLISIVVPTFNTPQRFLRAMIESVRMQSYTNWELCIADGSTEDKVYAIANEYISAGFTNIIYRRLTDNSGIAGNTNAGIEMAHGEWIGFLDHDDTLSPEALFQVVQVINTSENVDLIYSDEDKMDINGRKYFAPHFKPSFSIDLLRSNNYITHFLIVRRELQKKVGLIQDAYEGAQDYDFVLRCSEQARKIVHIPKILYHWRQHKNSTAAKPESKMYAYIAGKRALEAHLQRQGIKGNVVIRKELGFYDVHYDIVGEPLVSIIIPNKDNIDVLHRCLKSIDRSTYKNIEIIIVENNSQEDVTFKYYDGLNETNFKYPIKLVTWGGPFNYSSINNYGVTHAEGEYIVLLNNDIEIISRNWVEELLGNCQRPEVGVVGAKLYYPNDTIQHAGIVLGQGDGMTNGGVAGSMFVGLQKNSSFKGYMHKSDLQLNYSAVTAACMMVKKSVFDKVEGLEEALTVAFNDVDFCIKVNQAGYLVVYNPHVEAYHYESLTRGQEDSPEKADRFQKEGDFMRKKWKGLLKSDPFYNPNLSLKSCNYKINI